MIQFNSNLDEQTLLKNTNTLMHFLDTPSSARYLSLNKANEIVVNQVRSSPRRPMHPRIDFPLPKKLLLWHWSQLEPYIRKRFQEIAEIPCTNLQTYYSLNHTMQGLRFLCSQFVSQMQAINRPSVFSKNKRSKQVDMNWEKVKKDADLLLLHMGASQKLKLVQIVDVIDFHFQIDPVNGVQGGVTTQPTFMPRNFEVTQRPSNASSITIKANFRVRFDSEPIPTQAHISDYLTFKFFHAANMLPALLSAYPAWVPEGKLYPALLQKDLQECPFGPTQTVSSYFKKQRSGVIGFQRADLIVTMVGIFDRFQSRTLLPFFQCMVELGFVQEFNRIVFYAPNDFSCKARAFGFFTQDVQRPTIIEQNNAVIDAFVKQKTVALADENFIQEDAQGEALLRPHYFDMTQISQPCVFLTEEKLITSYVELMRTSKLLDDEKNPQGVFPERYQIPFLPHHFSFAAIKNREITGRLNSRGMAFGSEKLDFNALKDDKALQAVGEMSSLNEPGQELIRFCRGV